MAVGWFEVNLKEAFEAGKVEEGWRGFRGGSEGSQQSHTFRKIAQHGLYVLKKEWK